MSKNTTNLSPAEKFNQISLQYPLTNVFVNSFPSLIPYATAIKELSFYPLKLQSQHTNYFVGWRKNTPIHIITKLSPLPT